MPASATARVPWSDRVLSALEAAGNKLPQPFNLFVWLFAVVAS